MTERKKGDFEFAGEMVAALGRAVPAVMSGLATSLRNEYVRNLHVSLSLLRSELYQALKQLKRQKDTIDIKSSVIRKLQQDKAELVAALNTVYQHGELPDMMECHVESVLDKHTRKRKPAAEQLTLPEVV